MAASPNNCKRQIACNLACKGIPRCATLRLRFGHTCPEGSRARSNQTRPL